MANGLPAKAGYSGMIRDLVQGIFHPWRHTSAISGEVEPTS
jgi:hypothetical protein